MTAIRFPEQRRPDVFFRSSVSLQSLGDALQRARHDVQDVMMGCIDDENKNKNRKKRQGS